MDLVQLGRTDIRISPLGLGTWAWGDRMFWGYGSGYGEGDLAEAYRLSLDAGINWVDTAEIYGRGKSEQIVGRLEKDRRALIATKFFPLRMRPDALPRALDASLARLGEPAVDLYQIHWPAPWLRTRPLMRRLAEAVRSGKAKAVGVSNYPVWMMRWAHQALAEEGIPLASNQVEYSLLHRRPEANGLLEACRELGVTLIAYSPLAQGALSGKYTPTNRPTGPRRFRAPFRGHAPERAMPLVNLLKEIGARHGKTPSQVALRWLIQQPNVVAIPGAKNAKQAQENAGALAFKLDSAEVDALDGASRGWRH